LFFVPGVIRHRDFTLIAKRLCRRDAGAREGTTGTLEALLMTPSLRLGEILRQEHPALVLLLMGRLCCWRCCLAGWCYGVPIRAICCCC